MSVKSLQRGRRPLQRWGAGGRVRSPLALTWPSECQPSPVPSVGHQQKGTEGACTWSAQSVAWNGAGSVRLSGPETAWLAIGSDNEYATLMSETNSIYLLPKSDSL